MKKNYEKPQIEVVTVNCHILAGSRGVDSVESDGIFSGTISGGSGGGRSRGADDWDDDED